MHIYRLVDLEATNYEKKTRFEYLRGIKFVRVWVELQCCDLTRVESRHIIALY